MLLAFDPFMQQVISYPVLPVNITDGIAAAKQLHGTLISPAELANFTMEEAFEYTDSLSNDFVAAWAQGIWSGSNDRFEVTPVCSSGNCTWEEFTSVGICSQCSDMTASAVVDCNPPIFNSSSNNTCQIKIPDGDAYNFSVTTQTWLRGNLSRVSFDLPQSVVWGVYENGNASKIESLGNVTFGGMTTPIAAYGYATLNFSTPANPSLDNNYHDLSVKRLTVCGLGDCLRRYNVSTSNGRASIQTVGDQEFGVRHNNLTRRLNYTDSDEPHFTFGPGEADFTSCWTPHNESKADFAYCVPWFNSTLALVSRGQYLLPVSDNQILCYDNGSRKPYTVFISDYLISRIDDFGFDKVMSNVAASLTKLQLQKTKETFSGTAKSSEVFVKVRWEWMILPGFLVLAGSGFFIATIVVNRKAQMPLWKSSALATLYHGLERQEGDSDKLGTAISMQVEAESSKVRLMSSDGDEDGHLVLRRRSFRVESTPNVPGPDPTPSRFGSSAAMHGYTRI